MTLADELRARDRFLARVSEQLEARVAEVRDGRDPEALNRLAAFSRELALIAGGDAAPSGSADLADVVARLYAERKDGLARAGRDVRYEGVTARVPCDAFEIECMFLELLTNALKYGVDPIVITVTADGRFVVRDSGPGVSPADADRIFEKFVRGRQDRDGYGVGLWLVRRIARAHGGDLRLARAERGAVFEVTLPLV